MTITEAIVLAGGRASRLDGANKPRLEVGGVALLDGVLAGLHAVGVARVIVVGLPDALVREPGHSGHSGLIIEVVQEDPPFAGPALALATGLAHTTTAEVFVFACDLPRAAEAAALLARAPDREADAVLLRDGEGRDQWLAGRYRTSPLRRALDTDASARPGAGGRGAPLHRLLGTLQLSFLDDLGTTADIDTWEDLARERERFSERLTRTTHDGNPR